METVVLKSFSKRPVGKFNLNLTVFRVLQGAKTKCAFCFFKMRTLKF